MRRNRSPHSPLTWSVTILLTWATFVSVSDSKTITCKVPPVAEDQLVILTCDYGEKMYRDNSGKEIIVEHHFENGTKERILDCSRKDRASKYTCQRKKVEFQTDITENSGRSVSVPFTANKNKEGLYYCKTPGMTSTACHFTLKRKPAPSGWKTFAIVLLCLIILCALIVGVFLFNTRYRNRYSRYKPVVLSNAIESLVSIVCSMKIMNEKLEPERVDDAKLLVTKAGTGFEAEVTVDLPPIMARLWKDPKVQDFVRQESENLQLDSGAYFLNSLDRITAPDYKPTKEDVDKAWVKVADAGKTSFTFQALHQRFLRQPNSTAEGAASDMARETDHPARESDHLLSGSEKTT